MLCNIRKSHQHRATALLYSCHLFCGGGFFVCWPYSAAAARGDVFMCARACVGCELVVGMRCWCLSANSFLQNTVPEAVARALHCGLETRTEAVREHHIFRLCPGVMCGSIVISNVSCGGGFCVCAVALLCGVCGVGHLLFLSARHTPHTHTSNLETRLNCARVGVRLLQSFYVYIHIYIYIHMCCTVRDLRLSL